MPKSGAKAKAGGKRAASRSDFAKVRHKVGRKLPQASNVTNTSVTAKRIVLPGQTLGADRSERALTSRGLAVEEVLAQVAHYSARVRREALLSLRQLLGDNPWLLALHAPRVFGALAPRLADEEREVRAALRALLRDTVLPALPPAALAPFVPLLALHTAGAMTHLDAGVRRDALPTLQLLLAAAPGAVCAGAPAAMLRQLRHVLGGGAAGVRWTPAQLGAACAALQALLAALAQHLRSRAPGDAAGADDADEGCDDDEQPPPWEWRPGALPAEPLHARRAWGATQDEAAAAGAAGEPAEEAAAACAALAPQLVTVWAQLAPSLLDPAGADADTLACLLAVLRCAALSLAVCAAAAAVAAPSRAAAACLAAADEAMRAAHGELLASLGRHFPVAPSAAAASPEGRAAVAELNTAVAALIVRPQHAAGAAQPAPALHARVAAHIADALRAAAAARGGGGGADGEGGAAHAQLLPLAVGALRHPATAPAERAALLAALGQLWDAAPPRSAHKAAALRVMRGLLRASPPLVPAEAAFRWLASLPRLLFDLRHAQPDTSLLALRTLRDAARAAAQGSPAASALAALEPELAPFFALSVGGRPPRAGPFLQLPRGAQAEALALLAGLPSLSAPTLRALALCALSPGAQPGAPSLAAEAVACAAGAALPLRLGWVATLLLGRDAQGAAGLQLPGAAAAAPGGAGGGLTWRQRGDVAAAACCGLAALAPRLGDDSPWAPLAALWPAAAASEALAQPRAPRHVAFAFLRAAADAAAASRADPEAEDDAPPPPLLAAPLARLLVDYLVAAAEERVLAAPPQPPAACADENEPGLEPASRLLAACAPLLAGVAAGLAALARADAAAAPLCLTALAALAARPDVQGPLLRNRAAVSAAAAELAPAEGLPPPLAAVARHLREALKQLFAHD